MPAYTRSRYRELVCSDLRFWFGIRYESLHRRHWRAIDAMHANNRATTFAVVRMLRIINEY